jgi:hypothetical protein
LVAGQWEAATGGAAEARSVPLSPRDDHDACELEIVGHQRIALPDHPAAVDVSPDPERDALPPALREPGDSLALYLTAPKTSPPA